MHIIKILTRFIYTISEVQCEGNPSEPCYILSGATTVYSQDLSRDVIQQDVAVGIQEIFDSGLLTEMFDEIVGAVLLDSSLNPATPIPTFVPQPTSAPDILPGTVAPTDAPNVNPGTFSPTSQASSPTIRPVPTISLSPTTIFRPTGEPTPFPTGPTVPPPTTGSNNDDSDPPLFPLWAWITLGVGVGTLILVCLYFNLASNQKPTLESDKNKHNRLESKDFSTDDDISYVPPAGPLDSNQKKDSSAPGSNRYLLNTTSGDENRISMKPDGENNMMNSPTVVIYEEEEEEEEDQEGDDSEDGEQDEEEGGTILGEFQVVATTNENLGSESDAGDENEEDEGEGDEYDDDEGEDEGEEAEYEDEDEEGSSFEEESYTEEGTC